MARMSTFGRLFFYRRDIYIYISLTWKFKITLTFSNFWFTSLIWSKSSVKSPPWSADSESAIETCFRRFISSVRVGFVVIPLQNVPSSENRRKSQNLLNKKLFSKKTSDLSLLDICRDFFQSLWKSDTGNISKSWKCWYFSLKKTPFSDDKIFTYFF